MGKGTIISGGTDGQYQVQKNYDRTAYDAELVKLDAQITDWTDKISDKDAEIIALENERIYLIANDFLPEIIQEKNNEISKAEKEKASLQIYLMSFEKRKQFLENNMPDDETISAWCADLTEDLTGEIGTVEIPGESTYIQIQPGYEANAVYNIPRDGQLLPTVVASAAQSFYNLAMMPGWQKWKPLFRYGTITAIDGDTASVAVEGITSSQQALVINQTDSLTGVAIEYMSCNGGAFEVDDEVLLKFEDQEWDSPVIVGFKDHPKTCDYTFFVRPAFNGHPAVNGGQSIELRYADMSLSGRTTGTYYSQEDTPVGMCKFTVTEDIAGVRSGDTETFLYLHRGRSSLLSYDDPRGVSFCAVVGSPGDPSIFEYGFFSPEILDWKISLTNLSNAAKSSTTIDDVIYDVYDIEFTDLKIIKRTPNEKTRSNTYPLAGMAGTYEDGTCIMGPVEKWYFNAWNDERHNYNDCYLMRYGPGEPALIRESRIYGGFTYCDLGGLDGSYSQSFFDSFTSSESQPWGYGCSLDSNAIVTDSDGNNPTFISRTISDIEIWDNYWGIQDTGGANDNHYMQETSSWGWTYEMIDMPAIAY